MKNILSKLWINTNNSILKQDRTLNLKSQIAYIDKKEHMFVTKQNNLFTLMRQIKHIYTKIATNLSDSNEFIAIIMVNSEELLDKMEVYYNVESELRSELYVTSSITVFNCNHFLYI